MPPQPDTPNEVRLTEETVQHLQTMMAAAVREGMAASITEDTAAAFWSAGLAVLQKQATQHAGRFVLGGLWGLLRKASLFLLLGGFMYAVGGWSALYLLFNSLFTKPP